MAAAIVGLVGVVLGAGIASQLGSKWYTTGMKREQIKEILDRVLTRAPE